MANKTPRMTPALFHVLLSLAEGPKHGYALLSEVSERSNGKVDLGPSTLYYSLGRLEDAGLIRRADSEAEARADSAGEPHEDQRRYFALTDDGRDTLESEIDALSTIVDHARAIGFSGRRR